MLTERNKAMMAATGYTGQFGGSGDFQDWLAGQSDAIKSRAHTTRLALDAGQPVGTQVGVKPALVEPLHDYEKAGITTLGNPSQLTGGIASLMQYAHGAMDAQGFASTHMNSMAMPFLEQAGAQMRASAAPITLEEAQEVANPYATALKSQLSTDADKVRQAVLANQGMRGGLSFGDSVTAEALSDVNKEELQGRMDIDYNTLTDAFQLLQNNRSRQATAGTGLGSLATGAQGVTSSATGAGVNGLQALLPIIRTGFDIETSAAGNQIEAGQAVRDYNQGVNNIVLSEIANAQGYDLNNLQNIFALMSNYQSQLPTTVETGGGGSTIGGLLSGVGSIASVFSDVATKENIIEVGMQGGLSLYEYNYLGDSQRYRGVLAQDVERIKPEAVMLHPSGFKMVDYGQLPVSLEAVDG